MMGKSKDPRSGQGRLHRWLRWSLLGCAGLAASLAAASCGGSAGGGPPLLQSNTNWLQRCGPEAPCSGALICLCGMCTQPCSEESECGRLEGASCGGSCEDDAPSGGGLCVLGCTTDDDCGDSFMCLASECRPRPPELDEQALGDEQVGTAGACSNAFISLDSVYERANQDLDALDANARPFMRYISLANRSNAGACDDELELERLALTKALNSTSLETTLSSPVPIDADRLLYRINLLDYGWDQPRTLDGVVSDSAWTLIIKNTAHAISFVGPDVDRLKDQTRSSVPLLPANALTYAITRAEVYMTMVQQPATLTELMLDELGIDVEANRQNGEAWRAATTQSRISRADRIIERHQLEVRAGVAWMTLDFTSDPNPSVLQDPFATEADGGTVTYSLPNGLPAFAIYDGDGLLRADSDILLDTNQNNFRALTAVSCMNCHADAIIPTTDEVRAFVLANPDEYSPEDRALVTQLYPDAEVWRDLMAADNAAFRSATENLGIARGGVDPVATAVFRFERDVTPADMAGDLMLAPSDADALASELGLELTIGRRDFEQRLEDRLCVSLANARNRPAVCATR
jgi:hypothetical protein